jgi:hypothetical protein
MAHAGVNPYFGFLNFWTRHRSREDYKIREDRHTGGMAGLSILRRSPLLRLSVSAAAKVKPGLVVHGNR